MHNGSIPEKETLLIQAFNQGNHDALNKILIQFHSSILFFALRLTGDKPQSEDIVSDTFMKLFERRANFKTIANIKAFLYITTKNDCLNWLQRDRRVNGHVVSLSGNEEAYNVAEPADDKPVWSSKEMEVIAQVRMIVDLLPPRCKDIFIRHYEKGEKVNDIARDLKIEPGTVSEQLKRARAKLRAGLLLTMLLIIGVIMIFS